MDCGASSRKISDEVAAQLLSGLKAKMLASNPNERFLWLRDLMVYSLMYNLKAPFNEVAALNVSSVHDGSLAGRITHDGIMWALKHYVSKVRCKMAPIPRMTSPLFVSAGQRITYEEMAGRFEKLQEESPISGYIIDDLCDGD